MTAIAPFRIQPERKERVWGGTRLGEHDPPYGEAWIVCDQNSIASGPLAGQSLAGAVLAHPIEILGQSVFDAEGPVFPLLIKLLDPADWLSIQVHPDDALALEIEGAGFRGKTEAWYVLEADPGAELIAGVEPGVAQSDVTSAIRDGSLEPLLERHPVRAGDSLLVEAGLIHALGPGIFIYEVQQSSDLTYRVSDWGRPASAGRALHIEQSVSRIQTGVAATVLAYGQAPPERVVSDFGMRSTFSSIWSIRTAPTIERDTEGRSFEAITVIAGSATLVSGE